MSENKNKSNSGKYSALATASLIYKVLGGLSAFIFAAGGALSAINVRGGLNFGNLIIGLLAAGITLTSFWAFAQLIELLIDLATSSRETADLLRAMRQRNNKQQE